MGGSALEQAAAAAGKERVAAEQHGRVTASVTASERCMLRNIRDMAQRVTRHIEHLRRMLQNATALTRGAPTNRDGEAADAQLQHIALAHGVRAGGDALGGWAVDGAICAAGERPCG